jgi:hypothetical protein
VTNLKGAVPDADAIHDYIQEALDVPSSQIRCLRNAEATRAAILREINGLINDDLIQHGDAIFIFYAGHGSAAPAPVGWETEGSKIQFILPHDHLCANEKGVRVHGIPDRTLGVLLERLASAKGDNIVRLRYFRVFF